MAASYPTTPGVTFKDIPGFPGYCVGDYGSAWSRKVPGRHCGKLADQWQLLRSTIDHTGYKVVSMRDADGRMRKVAVHRLVLLAFVGQCPDGMQCCHFDGNRLNNRLSNLRWDTRKANAADAIRHGTMARGVKNGFAKLTDEDIRTIRQMAAGGFTQRRIAKEFGVARPTISRIVNERTWGHVQRVEP